MKMLHSSQFLIRVCVCVYVRVCACVCVCHLACRSTCFCYHLMGAMSLLKHQLFIWQSLLFVTSNMRSGASGDTLSLEPETSQINGSFESDKLRKQKSSNLTMWCNYSSFYLRELLCHLINTDRLLESVNLQNAALFFGRGGMKWFVRGGTSPTGCWD